MSFKQFQFDTRINRTLADVGFETPTAIQQKAIPPVLAGRDILGIAQTGTGKTAAFALPILQRLTTGPLRQSRALVLAPTRELAEQIHQAFVDLGRHMKVRSVTVYGGVSKRPQVSALRHGAEIIVACPGRLLDHMGAGDVDLGSIEVLVLDEADRMCDMGFLPDIRRILAKLPKDRQTLFFSATMPREIRSLAEQILIDPVTVQIGHSAPAKSVSHTLFPVREQDKSDLLIAMLRRTSTGRVLVFTRTKHKASRLAHRLKKERFRATELQGNMTQSQRQCAMESFRSGKVDVLVATDVAARGIDVDGISHVINFDMPESVDAYTHRIGRTGRLDKRGMAFTLAVRGDGLMIRQIEKAIGKSLKRCRVPGFDYGQFTPERQFAQAAGRLPSSRGSGRGRTGGRLRVRTVRSH